MELKYQFSENTDTGLVRKKNEDFLANAETPNGHVFVVCDGMGGHVGGATASKLAVNNIIEYFKREKYPAIPEALKQAISFANEQVYANALADSNLKGMGTTVVVMVIRDNKIFLAHVGDSRIYLLTDKKLHRLTKDHSLVQKLVDQGIITDEQAESHHRKNELTKALGVNESVEVEVAEQPVNPKKGDVLMLCSDGLCGLVNDMTMQEILVEKTKNLEQKTNELIEVAKNAGGTDNISVQLIKIEESPHHKSLFIDHTPAGTVTTSDQHTDTIEIKPPEKTSDDDPKNFTDRLFRFVKKNIYGILIAILAIVIITLFAVLWPSIFNEEEKIKFAGVIKGAEKDSSIYETRAKAEKALQIILEEKEKDGSEYKLLIYQITSADTTLISEMKRVLNNPRTSKYAAFIYIGDSPESGNPDKSYFKDSISAIKFVNVYLDQHDPKLTYYYQIWKKDSSQNFGKTGKPVFADLRKGIMKEETGKEKKNEKKQRVDEPEIEIDEPEPKVEDQPARSDSAKSPLSEEVIEQKKSEFFLVPEDAGWTTVYREFKVCPCYIKDHPENKRKFTVMKKLKAGETIYIPLKYSGDSTLNPKHWKNFTPERMGWDPNKGKCKECN